MNTDLKAAIAGGSQTEPGLGSPKQIALREAISGVAAADQVQNDGDDDIEPETDGDLDASDDGIEADDETDDDA